jgi:hypothetical protein
MTFLFRFAFGYTYGLMTAMCRRQLQNCLLQVLLSVQYLSNFLICIRCFMEDFLVPVYDEIFINFQSIVMLLILI